MGFQPRLLRIINSKAPGNRSRYSEFFATCLNIVVLNQYVKYSMPARVAVVLSRRRTQVTHVSKPCNHAMAWHNCKVMIERAIKPVIKDLLTRFPAVGLL